MSRGWLTQTLPAFELSTPQFGNLTLHGFGNLILHGFGNLANPYNPIYTYLLSPQSVLLICVLEKPRAERSRSRNRSSREKNNVCGSRTVRKQEVLLRRASSIASSNQATSVLFFYLAHSLLCSLSYRSTPFSLPSHGPPGTPSPLSLSFIYLSMHR